MTTRSLDRRVAQALGWTAAHAPWSRSGAQERTHWFNPSGENQELPHYSTSIADAMALIEHLRSKGWVMTLSVNEYVTEPWDCRFFLDSQHRDVYSAMRGLDRRVIAHGNTPAMAICAAFLKVMEAA